MIDNFSNEHFSAQLRANLARVMDSASSLVHQSSLFPSVAITNHPSWFRANWSATTFQWHPQSQAPPIMGLVFDDPAAATEIFQDVTRRLNNADTSEEIRISIIEGAPPGEQTRPAYTVHIGPQPMLISAHLKIDSFQNPLIQSILPSLLGQWNRHFPIPGSPPLLPRFKEEFAKHKEYLLAPVLKGADGKLWARPELGIIKRQIHFRNISEIQPDDIDAAALVLPQLVRPPGEGDSKGETRPTTST